MLRRRNRNALRLAAYALFSVAAIRVSGPPWLTDLGRISLFVAIFSGYSLWTILRQFRNRHRMLVDVRPDGVRSVDARGRDRTLARDQIASVRDVLHGGFYVRSRDPRLGVLVPADLIDLDACRREIIAMDVPNLPAPRALMFRAFALGVMFTALASMAIANTLVIRILAIAVFAATALFLSVWRERDRESGDVCAVPDPAARTRTLTRMRWWSLGLSVAGIGVAIVQAWWTKSTHGLGVGLGMVFLGGTGLMIFVARERLVIATAWVAALAAIGAAIGAVVLWLEPASDLGGDLMMFVGFVAALDETALLLTSMFDRMPHLRRWGDVLVASGLLAVIAVRHARHHTVSAELFASAAVVAFTLAMHRDEWRAPVVAVAAPLRLCILAVGMIATVMGNRDVSFWAWTVFIVLPDWWQRPVPRASAA